MGDYAASTDIQRAIAQFTIGTELVTTSGDVDSFIAEIEGEINTTLDAQGVTVPVTAPGWFVASLKALTIYGVSAEVMRANFPVPQTLGAQPQFGFFESRYKAGIKRITDGKIPQSAARSAQVRISSYFTANPDEEQTADELGELAGAAPLSVNPEIREF